MTGIARASKHFYSPMPRYLNLHVRRCTEAIKAQSRARFNAGEPQRPESNNSCTKQRRGLFIGKSLWNRIDKILRRNDIFGISAIHAVAGERRIVAKIFRAGAAIFTSPVGLMLPVNSNSRSISKPSRILTLFLYDADNLVSGNHARFARWQLSFNDVQICSAHAASADTHQ